MRNLIYFLIKLILFSIQTFNKGDRIILFLTKFTDKKSQVLKNQISPTRSYVSFYNVVELVDNTLQQ